MKKWDRGVVMGKLRDDRAVEERKEVEVVLGAQEMFLYSFSLSLLS